MAVTRTDRAGPVDEGIGLGRYVPGLGDRVSRWSGWAVRSFVSASPAMNYMELYPFVNRLWYAAGRRVRRVVSACVRVCVYVRACLRACVRACDAFDVRALACVRCMRCV